VGVETHPGGARATADITGPHARGCVVDPQYVCVWHLVPPLNSSYAAQTAHVKLIQFANLVTIRVHVSHPYNSVVVTTARYTAIFVLEETSCAL